MGVTVVKTGEKHLVREVGDVCFFADPLVGAIIISHIDNKSIFYSNRLRPFIISFNGVDGAVFKHPVRAVGDSLVDFSVTASGDKYR